MECCLKESSQFALALGSLLSGLSALLGRALTVNERQSLSNVLDPTDTGEISSAHCFRSVARLYDESVRRGGPSVVSWLVSKSHATRLLEIERVGTFLVRLTSRSPNAFSLAHTMANNVVNHVILHKRENGTERLFPSLQHLLAAYPGHLQHPCRQTFRRQPQEHRSETNV